MRFEPPRCPNSDCPQHKRPKRRFYEPRGYYRPKCRTEPVPRFRCLTCRRGFSRQTFRHDYGDRRPDTNVPVFRYLVSGVGLRQTARQVGLNPKSVQGKMRKFARTFALLHGNLSRRLPPGRTFVLDEEETYESASIRPVTMPVLIERATWFVVGSAVGSIRRLAPAETARRRKQEAEEARFGRRKDQSRGTVRKVFELLRKKLGKEDVLHLVTDQKSTYGPLARSVFGGRVRHEETSSRLARGTFNPLFPINTTLAMTRDNNGRLRRRSWLVTKKRRFLHSQMQLFQIYRNYVRQRFNRDEADETPGRLLGLLPRGMAPHESLAWRQDWGARSIHPFSADGRTSIGEARSVELVA